MKVRTERWRFVTQQRFFPYTRLVVWQLHPLTIDAEVRRLADGTRLS